MRRVRPMIVPAGAAGASSLAGSTLAASLPAAARSTMSGRGTNRVLRSSRSSSPESPAPLPGSLLMARTPLCCLSLQRRSRQVVCTATDRHMPCGSHEWEQQALAHGLHVGAKPQSNLAQLHKIAIVQIMRLLLDLVDDDTVAAAEVRDDEAALVRIEMQHRMPTRDGIVEQADVVVTMAADAHVGRLQGVARSVAVE